MSSNTLRTRIRSKIDYLANWNSQANDNFIPLLGEICIAIIPRNITGTSTDSTSQDYIGAGINDSLGVKGVENQPRSGVGLTPYAIGIKVGDGSNPFKNLPWIQAIAGDIYAWAKAATPPSASNISVNYNNNENSNVQAAITGIEASLGGLVAGNISAADLGAALAQLTEQLAGADGTLFDSNYTIPTNENETPTALPSTLLVRKIEQNGLNLQVTGTPITETDLPNISMNKISDLSTTANYNSNTNPIATKGYVDSEITVLRNQISGTMTFLGIVHELDLLANNSQIITDGAAIAPIFRVAGTNPQQYNTVAINDLKSGSVILYKEIVTTTTIDPETNAETTVNSDAPIGKEFIWTGAAWELLGDEGSYAVKGSIEYNDLNSTLQNIIDSKLDNSNGKITKLDNIEANAQVNVIESVKVNGTALSISNKSVDIPVPTGALASLDTVAEANLASALLTKINGKANTSDLHTIATTGKIDDIEQDNVIILNCGDAGSNLFTVT